jgi:hypothetical protein
MYRSIANSEVFQQKYVSLMPFTWHYASSIPISMFTGILCFNCSDHHCRTTSIPPSHSAANPSKPCFLLSSSCTRTWRGRRCHAWRIQRFSGKGAWRKSLTSARDESAMPYPPPFHSLYGLVVVDVNSSCAEYLLAVFVLNQRDLIWAWSWWNRNEKDWCSL